MPINFHDARNARTYATREADPSWTQTIFAIVDPVGKRVVDIGCGGGIYTRAWAKLGAASVRGVDFSDVMVNTARERCADLSNVAFQQGDALATGLPDASADIIWERALLHHLTDLPACAREAARILAPGGLYLAQDRTPDDQRVPGAPDHLRGYINERFPRLLEIELRRRPTSEQVRAALEGAGFQDIQERTFWETRRVYSDFAALAEDLRDRVDRSILHELSEAEIEELIDHIRERVPASGPITDASRWTLWWGTKPR
jgi:ubiquinone/menaquinone biosynthesis C-methylase UbiE